MKESNIRANAQAFYSAFNTLDYATMNQFYADEAQFEDPAFGLLNSAETKSMWQMLCSSQTGKEFKVVCHINSVQGNEVRLTWEAWYSFSLTKRKVHNVIQARMIFDPDGLIINHLDQFNVHRWSRQAMGLTGLLLGWTPFFKKKLKAKTRKMLRKFEANQ